MSGSVCKCVFVQGDSNAAVKYTATSTTTTTPTTAAFYVFLSMNVIFPV